MSSKRFLSPWKNSSEKPVIYHCVSRVVDRHVKFPCQNSQGNYRTFLLPWGILRVGSGE